MKIVLLTGGYDPARAARAAAVAAAEPPGPGLLIPGPAALDAATPGAEPPVVKVADHIGREGQFAHVQLMKKFAAVIATRPAALVLDGVTNTGRYSDLDAHGRGADYLTAAVAKAMYWHEYRPVLVHFCLPSMHAYFAREWGKYVHYAPVESLVAWHADTPKQRVQGMVHRAAARLAPHTLGNRIKKRLGLPLVGRLLRAMKLVRR